MSDPRPIDPALPDPVPLAQRLIACDSVTPATGAVFAELAAMLEPLGFAVERFVSGVAPDGPVENLIAVRAGPDGSGHFALAGHLDVVPAGAGWTSAPFTPVRRGDLLVGRGAVDMKGAIAAMVAAVAAIPVDAGTISMLITGDEEGPAQFGTVAIIARLQERGLRPDLCLVGEPTSVERLGDMVKIGRRGSVNMWLTAQGAQGHVAYPQLADNPIPRLITLLTTLDAMEFDTGSAWFQPTNLEITDLAAGDPVSGNPATNVIPAEARARLSIRFNDLQRGPDLVARVTALAAAHRVDVHAVISGEAFLTMPGAFSTLVSHSITAETGIVPTLSTTGGTSDARFLRSVCPVIEFGLSNATMHKTDEAVAMVDLTVLARIYRRIALAALVQTAPR